MNQKTKTIALKDYCLGLSSNSLDTKIDGIAKEIKNVNILNGELSNADTINEIFEIIEPTRVNVLKDTFLNIVKDALSVVSYKFYNAGVEIEYLIFCNSDYRLYYYQLNSQNPSFTYLSTITFTSLPHFEFFIKDQKNHILMWSNTDEMYVWDGTETPYQVLDAPKISSMAVGLDRLFVVSKDHPYSVLYSDDLDPSNWSVSVGEAGEITFTDNMGKVLYVFALDNYLYAIREYGIVKIYGYKQSSNTFSLSRIFTSTSNIHKDTICVVGDKVVFLTDSGLYSFNGLSCKKIFSQLDNMFINNNVCSAKCINNIYYLACNLYDNKKDNNCLLVLNLDTNKLEQVLENSFINRLDKISINNKQYLVCYQNYKTEKTAKYPYYLCKNVCKTGECGDFLYKTNNLDILSNVINKQLKSISLISKHNLELILETQKDTKKIIINKSDYPQIVLLNLPVTTFSFSILGTGLLCVKDVKLTFSYMEN